MTRQHIKIPIIDINIEKNAYDVVDYDLNVKLMSCDVRKDFYTDI